MHRLGHLLDTPSKGASTVYFEEENFRGFHWKDSNLEIFTVKSKVDPQNFSQQKSLTSPNFLPLLW